MNELFSIGSGIMGGVLDRAESPARENLESDFGAHLETSTNSGGPRAIFRPRSDTENIELQRWLLIFVLGTPPKSPNRALLDSFVTLQS